LHPENLPLKKNQKLQLPKIINQINILTCIGGQRKISPNQFNCELEAVEILQLSEDN
jgi:hypothetical protein